LQSVSYIVSLKHIHIIFIAITMVYFGVIQHILHILCSIFCIFSVFFFKKINNMYALRHCSSKNPNFNCIFQEYQL
jgi:hypothetical protein